MIKTEAVRELVQRVLSSAAQACGIDGERNVESDHAVSGLGAV